MVGAGAFDPSTTRVLHVKPSARLDGRASAAPTATATMTSTTAMQTPMAAPRSDGAGGTGGAPNTLSTTTAAMDADKRRERLKELFQRQILLFKEAVYLLLGYKIDMTPDPQPQIRVRSMFAESPEHALLFRFDPDTSRLELLENDYTKSLSPNVFAYLTQCGSVPAFLSTLTLDLFERSTVTFSGAALHST